MPLGADLAGKSVQAAVAAIEVYNKPNFSYRPYRSITASKRRNPHQGTIIQNRFRSS
jgi:hypothetical protein